MYQGVIVPVVFALLPNKKQQTYHHLTDKLSEICLPWNPKFITMDFERSAIKEFSDTFTATTNPATMLGCLFHLQNSIYRKVQVNI